MGGFLEVANNKWSKLQIDSDKDFSGPALPHVFNPAWTDTSYGWRKSIIITGTTAGAQTSYQVKFNVIKTIGVDSGNTIYCGNNCKNDFSDLRFYNNSGIALPYWVESYVSGSSAVVWVNVDAIPASPAAVTIWMYYSNPAAISASNGDTTFIFFDDFPGVSLNLTKWAAITQLNGTIIVGSSVAILDTGVGGGFASIVASNPSQPCQIETRMSVSAAYDALNQTRVRLNNDTQGFDIIIADDGGHPVIQVYWNSYSGVAVPLDLYLRFKTTYAGGNMIWAIEYENGVSIYTNTTPLGGNTNLHYDAGDGGGSMKTKILLDWVRVRNYASLDPTVTGSADDYYRTLDPSYYGLSDIKELIAGMNPGDIIAFDAATQRIAAVRANIAGTQLLTKGNKFPPVWGFPDVGDIGWTSMYPITQGSDDSLYNGAFANNATQVDGGNLAGTVLKSAMRFTGINIPAHVLIYSAQIIFMAQFTRAGQTVSSILRGELAANPATYGAAEDFTARAYTVSSQLWTPQSTWNAGVQYASGAVTAIVQELVKTFGAYVNGAMAFQWLDNGSGANNLQSAYSYDANPLYAPVLVITYGLL